MRQWLWGDSSTVGVADFCHLSPEAGVVTSQPRLVSPGLRQRMSSPMDTAVLSVMVSSQWQGQVTHFNLQGLGQIDLP